MRLSFLLANSSDASATLCSFVARRIRVREKLAQRERVGGCRKQINAANAGPVSFLAACPRGLVRDAMQKATAPPHPPHCPREKSRARRRKDVFSRDLIKRCGLEVRCSPQAFRVRRYRVSNATLDVVTGTEGPPEWEAAFLRYGTVCKTTTIDHAFNDQIRNVRRWLDERVLRFMR